MTASKELKTVIVLNTISIIMIGTALFLYFSGTAPQMTSLIILAIALPLELSQRYFAKDDPTARVFAKTSGLASVLALLLIYNL